MEPPKTKGVQFKVCILDRYVPDSPWTPGYYDLKCFTCGSQFRLHGHLSTCSAGRISDESKKEAMNLLRKFLDKNGDRTLSHKTPFPGAKPNELLPEKRAELVVWARQHRNLVPSMFSKGADAPLNPPLKIE